MAPSILVVDDDPKITQLLRRVLALEGYRVQIAASGMEGLRMVREHQPDLVILDVLMPGIDGFEVARRVRADGDTPILLLTARDEVADRVAGLDSGADDYLVKPFALEELLARVRALLRRREQSERAVFRFADLELDTRTEIARRGTREIPLSPTESKLLEHFLRHPRRVLTRDEILDAVWGGDFPRPTNVVDVYVGYLRTALEAEGETRLIQTIRGAGYALRSPTPPREPRGEAWNAYA